jgi:hypothetical protein
MQAALASGGVAGLALRAVDVHVGIDLVRARSVASRDGALALGSIQLLAGRDFSLLRLAGTELRLLPVRTRFLTPLLEPTLAPADDAPEQERDDEDCGDDDHNDEPGIHASSLSRAGFGPFRP